MSNLHEQIKKIPKTFFTLNDLQKITAVSENVLKVSLSRLIRVGKIQRLKQGYYTLDKNKIDWKQFALESYSPSYLSFEWALGYYNILSQQSYALTLATPRRNKEFEFKEESFIYHHLQKKHFWGFKQLDGALIAEPEKALLDQAYLSLNGRAVFDVEEMNLDNIDLKKMKKYLKKFDDKRLKKLIIESKFWASD